MFKIEEVTGGQWHWLMRVWGARNSDGRNAEERAGYSNTGYGVVKVDGKVVGLVTRYDYDNPRYFVDVVSDSEIECFSQKPKTEQAYCEMVI